MGEEKALSCHKAKEDNENHTSTSTTIEEWFCLFLKIFNNAPMLEQLKKNLERVVQEAIGLGESNGKTQKYIRRVKINKRRTGKVFRVNNQVVGFQIKDTMLDLGLDVNILPREVWEALGKVRLTYLPIQLCMANQYCIVPVGRLEEVEFNVAATLSHRDSELRYSTTLLMWIVRPYP